MNPEQSNLSLRVLLVSLLLISACSARDQHSRAPLAQTANHAVIERALQQIEDGWNTKQAVLFAKPFAHDADYVAINGLRTKGKESIQQAHERLFETRYAGKTSKVELSVVQARVLRPDLMLVHVSGRNTTQQPEGNEVIDMMLSLVLRRDSEEWKITAFQNTRIVPTP